MKTQLRTVQVSTSIATPASSNVAPMYVNGRPVKTSHTHPINISWVLPPEMLTPAPTALGKHSLASSRRSSQAGPPTKKVNQAATLPETGDDDQDNVVIVRNSPTKRPNAQAIRSDDEQPPTVSLPPTSTDADVSLTQPDDDAQDQPDEFEETGLNGVVPLTHPQPHPDGYIPDLVLSDKRVKICGNLALCSAPGKKVRLEAKSVQAATLAGFINRSPVNRDLDADFGRISSMGFSTIINLLSDEELATLQIPIGSYLATASKFGIDVIRYPMIEGGCPPDLEHFDQTVIDAIVERVNDGQNVICHCRGGIGRAGLVACCWLLRMGYCVDAPSSIRFIRACRSPRAIETLTQEQFIHQYKSWIHETSD